jgi:RND family efflux transporter MFP subunit
MSNRYADVVKCVCLTAATALAACSPPAPPAAAPAVVIALPVHAATSRGDGSLRYPIEAVARYQNVESFRVGGKIIERSVRLGDRVHAGQVLARLDDVDAGVQVDAARAALDASDHRLGFAKQQLDRDRAQAAEALIAANALEQTEDAYRTALAAREQAADQFAVARNTLRYHRLIADHDGAVTSENADTGQNVVAGQAVYGLAWSGAVDVVLDAAATDLPQIAIGQDAVVTFGALPGSRHAARVREIAPAADPSSLSFRVKLTLAPGAAGVRLGMTGDAELAPLPPPQAASGAAPGTRTAPRRPSFRIAATAVFHRDNGTAVWVVRTADSTLELRRVSVRRYTASDAYVDAGLDEGDEVVQAGVHTVFAGERVKPVEPLFADAAGAGR